MTNDELALLLEVANSEQHSGATLEERIRLLEDLRQISDLVMRYGWLCDARRWDEVLDLYTDDFERCLAGTLDECLRGKEALREVYERPVLPRKGGGADNSGDVARTSAFQCRHMIHPPVVRILDDGSRAVAAAVYSLVASEGEGEAFVRAEHEGGYIFGFRREPVVGWRFESMTVISEIANNPLFKAT